MAIQLSGFKGAAALQLQQSQSQMIATLLAGVKLVRFIFLRSRTHSHAYLRQELPAIFRICSEHTCRKIQSQPLAVLF